MVLMYNFERVFVLCVYPLLVSSKGNNMFRQ